MTTNSREWNSSAYHKVSNPQFEWGLKVLDRLSLRGDERVMDAGCGSGRLTAKLVERLPHGEVVGVDLSHNMLIHAAEHLGDRVRLVRPTSGISRSATSSTSSSARRPSTGCWITQRCLHRSLRRSSRAAGSKPNAAAAPISSKFAAGFAR